jgi:tetratricopeptide (TPR) repeat protein
MRTKLKKDGRESVDKESIEIAKEYREEGLWHKAQGNISEAKRFLQKSLTLNEKFNNLIGQAADFSSLGLIYKEEENLELALKFLQKSLTINEKYIHQVKVARDKKNLSRVHFARGDIQVALKLINKSIIDLSNTDLEIDKAASLRQKCIIVKESGKLVEAEEIINLAINLDSQIMFQLGLAEDYRILASIYRSKESYGKAHYHFSEALKIFVKLNNNLGKAITLNSMGINLAFDGELDDALKCIEESIELNGSFDLYTSKSRSLAIRNFRNIGYIYRKKRDYSRSLEYYYKSLSYSSILYSNFEIAKDYYYIGEVLLEKDDKKNASNYFENSIELLNLSDGVDLKSPFRMQVEQIIHKLSGPKVSIEK